MSQIEQEFRGFLSKRPEIEKCYAEGLINRRALARYLVRNAVAKQNQIGAVIAMLRRFEFKESEKAAQEMLKKMRISVKDKIIILDFEKEKALLQSLQQVISHINYDNGDTLKIVVGTASITLYVDSKKQDELKGIVSRFALKHSFSNISEISLIFPDEVINSKGITSTITRELALNDIVITEMLTASSELLIYVEEQYVIKAYGILKRLQE